MPTDLQKRDKPDSANADFSPQKSNGVSKQGATLAKAMQNMGKKKVIGSKPKTASKSSCICAPTTHAGSFKCHLHRMSKTQKQSSWKLFEDKDNNGSTQSFDSTNTNKWFGHHRQSRFGRAGLGTVSAYK